MVTLACSNVCLSIYCKDYISNGWLLENDADCRYSKHTFHRVIKPVRGLEMTFSTQPPQMDLLKVIHILGFAGLIPFFVPLGLLISQRWLDVYIPAHLPAFLFLSYSAIILSFMSGTLWARWQTIKHKPTGLRAVVMSNVLALIAWLALLVGFFVPQVLVVCLGVLALGYASLLLVERSLGVSEQRYWRMRLSLTTIVMVLHVLMIIMFLEF